MRISDGSSDVCSSDLQGSQSLAIKVSFRNTVTGLLAEIGARNDRCINRRFKPSKPFNLTAMIVVARFGGCELIGAGYLRYSPDPAVSISDYNNVHRLHIDDEPRSEERRVGKESVMTCR